VDITSSLRAMTEVGAEVVQDVMDVGGGLLIAKVKDADGNVVGLRQQSK
jgi:predicted enzyme related to lactoylglutathione lyase